MLPCLFKKLFGFDCIGCGFQRALNFLIHGDVQKAFLTYPPIFTSLLFFLSLGVFIFTKKRNTHKWVVALAILNSVVMLVSYIYKMRFYFNLQ
ncbi:DUF2752 domain-containing protein [Flavobacterium aciduliphilum]|nr:DUF2752 domain-containing protein [Flavobacterium aciduliphilum]